MFHQIMCLTKQLFWYSISFLGCSSNVLLDIENICQTNIVDKFLQYSLMSSSGLQFFLTKIPPFLRVPSSSPTHPPPCPNAARGINIFLVITSIFLHKGLEEEISSKGKDQNVLSFIAAVPSKNTTVLNGSLFMTSRTIGDAGGNGEST